MGFFENIFGGKNKKVKYIQLGEGDYTEKKNEYTPKKAETHYAQKITTVDRNGIRMVTNMEVEKLSSVSNVNNIPESKEEDKMDKLTERLVDDMQDDAKVDTRI